MLLSRASSRTASLIALARLALVAPDALRAQTSGPVDYLLSGPSNAFKWGCFPPCKCLINVRSPMSKTFTLRYSHSGPLFDYYDVLNVRWSADTWTQPMVITGSGEYRHDG